MGSRAHGQTKDSEHTCCIFNSCWDGVPGGGEAEGQIETWSGCFQGKQALPVYVISVTGNISVEREGEQTEGSWRNECSPSLSVCKKLL